MARIELDRAAVDRAFESLEAVPGMNPADWMLMSASEGDAWNGALLYHFKSRDTRLYVYIPSRWGFQDKPLSIEEVRG